MRSPAGASPSGLAWLRNIPEKRPVLMESFHKHHGGPPVKQHSRRVNERPGETVAVPVLAIESRAEVSSPTFPALGGALGIVL
jgi:hypothetical protein